MANKEQLDFLRQGSAAWKDWRERHRGLTVDLKEADLRGANLNGIQLMRADLQSADLTGADLTEAHLEDANLDRANLCEADLRRAVLWQANLQEANLEQANLQEANLFRASLSGTDLKSANARKASLFAAHLIATDISLADLTSADLSMAVLIETNLDGTTLNGCRVFGASVWRLQGNPRDQSNLLISSSDEPAIIVDNIETAQLVYLLLNHKKMREVIKAVADRGVLILGPFSHGGHERLEAIAAKLREMKYLPMIFDFDRPEGRNFTETVKTLVGLSRFVIADVIGPSVPQELYATVPHFKVPFVPIIEKGQKPYSMLKDILEYPWVVSPPVEFESQTHLIQILPSEIVAQAEEKHHARQPLLDTLD